jgi:hypothetical protein
MFVNRMQALSSLLALMDQLQASGDATGVENVVSQCYALLDAVYGHDQNPNSSINLNNLLAPAQA